MNEHPIADSVELPATTAVVSVLGSDGAGGHWSAECWRREVIEARSRAGALAAVHRQNKAKLEAARAEIRELRRQAKEPLRAAAEAGGPPTDLTPWLPWSMTPTERERLQQPRAPPSHA